MKTFEEYLQHYVNLSYDDLVCCAQMSVANLNPTFRRIFGDDVSMSNAYAIIIASCIGADDKLTSLESLFLSDVLGVQHDYDTNFNTIASLQGEQNDEWINTLINHLSEDESSHLLILCITFLAVDETISHEETAFIQRLIN